MPQENAGSMNSHKQYIFVCNKIYVCCFSIGQLSRQVFLPFCLSSFIYFLLKLRPELNFASTPAKTGGIFEATLLKTERLEDEEEMADGCNTIQEW